jgi:hypothetical protein
VRTLQINKKEGGVMDRKSARPLVALLSVTLSLYGLYGCATASKDLTATYASPMQYQGYDCDQIAAEELRISARVSQLGGRLDEAAGNDKAIVAVGAILFWPILFALGGTKQQEAEYSRLKGEYDALEQQAVLKKCSPVVRPSTMAAAPGAAPAQPVSPVATSAATAAGVATAASEPTLPSAAPWLNGSTIPSDSTSTVLVARSTSKYMVSAEQFAKGTNCESPVATMNIAAATYETFTIACTSAESMSVRCDNASCRTLQ